MILLADSGSTKTAWSLVDINQRVIEFTTLGINPFYQTNEEIKKELEECVYSRISEYKVENIYFYGAGCANEAKNQELSNLLKSTLKCENASVASDMLGAARGLLGTSCGIAAILGTGSNSCYYDGNETKQGVSAGGYILGDEGSGAVLGKLLIADFVKKQMPQHIYKALQEEYDIDYLTVVENVYKRPFPNRWLAQFTKFLAYYRKDEYINHMIVNSFTAFFERNIKQYPNWENLPVGFIGSVAYYFEYELRIAAEQCNITVGKILQNPIDGLIEFHTH